MPAFNFVYPFTELEVPQLLRPRILPGTYLAPSTDNPLEFELHPGGATHFTYDGLLSTRTTSRGRAIRFETVPPALTIGNEHLYESYLSRAFVPMPDASDLNEFTFFLYFRPDFFPLLLLKSFVVHRPPYFSFVWDHDIDQSRGGAIGINTDQVEAILKLDVPWERNKWYTLSFTCGKDYFGYVNGKPLEFTNIRWTPYSNTVQYEQPIDHGYDASFGYGFRGDVGFFGLWASSLSPSIHKALHADPLACLKPY
ncbi:MAG: hypothetical protein LPH21_06320 [Shewanella sp.]|nr:hypothetical protein [Shewanella sp.]